MIGRVAITLAWLFLLSCARADPELLFDEGAKGPETPLTEDVAIHSTWAKRVRSAHERASLASNATEKIEAAESMTHLAEEVRPGAPKAAAILSSDLKSRAAQLYLGAAKPELAKKLALQALSEAQEPSVARAQLLMTLADCERALGNAEAEQTALIEALSVNQTLFHDELQKP